ncbi:MAG: glycosyltransferase family 9 protein [Bacteriovoracaceae bacterium]|nr:glycosyltransferase family 9 protein [Bacteriovoracaceae bacterium]
MAHNNILIINMRRFGDIYTTEHLIGSIIQNNPNTQVSMLVYKEFEHAAKTLRNVSKLFVIDRKKIISIVKNDIFSDGYAVQKLYNDLDPIREKNWDQILNYSNDKIGSFITTHLTCKQSNSSCHGIKYKTPTCIEYPDDWSVIFNDILPCYKYTPVHFVDCYHQMLNIDWHKKTDCLDTNQEHDQVAADNLHKIRTRESHNGHQVKLVGIQLKSSCQTKDIPAESIIELINLILDDPKLYPILLIAPLNDEQQLANDINNYFDNSLITIESDFLALTSVIKNLDIIITPDTVTKHVADLVDTPLIEISLGASPFRKQGTYNPNSLVLTPISSKRNYSSEQFDDVSVCGNDIYNTIQYILGHIPEKLTTLSPNISIYKPVRDALGIKYVPLIGNFDVHMELSHIMSRYYLMSRFNIITSINFNDFTHFEKNKIKDWLSMEKNAVTNATKKVLSTLRSLLQSQKNIRKTKEFIQTLDQLLSICNSNSLVAIAALSFRARIESMSGSSFTKNIKEMESLLYTFRNEIQTILNCIKHLENSIAEQEINSRLPHATASDLKKTTRLHD